MKLKELIWIASSEKDLLKFPEDIRDFMILGLRLAQEGKKELGAKIMKGFGGASVIELIDEDPSGTYRVVYTIKMPEVVFVLHSFQKKSKEGIKTPKRDMDLIENRIRQAQEIYKTEFKKKK